jgi:hypothetical protein
LRPDSKEQQTVRQYLLGRASPADSSRLEERLLTDGAFYEELLIAEDELMDQYLHQELSPVERQSFESHFLAAPKRQKQLRFARSLQRYVASTVGEVTSNERPAIAPEEVRNRDAGPVEWNPFKRFLSRPALAFSLSAALLIVVAVSWIVISRRNEGGHQPGTVYAVVLTPGLVREGGETKKITIPPDVDTLRLQLELPVNEYESFGAALLTEDRREVWATEGLRPAANLSVVDFDVPSRILKPGDYHVKVRGKLGNGQIEDLHGFTFRVTR